MIASSGCGSSVEEKGVHRILLFHLNEEKIIEGDKLVANCNSIKWFSSNIGSTDRKSVV